MALGSTQPLKEMSTKTISWGWRRPVHKADNLPQSCAVVMKSVNLNFLEPSESLQACNGTDFYMVGWLFSELASRNHRGSCFIWKQMLM